jgi:hypothetical protein
MICGKTIMANPPALKYVLLLGVTCVAASAGATERDLDTPAAVSARLLARVDITAGQRSARRQVAVDLQTLERLGVHPIDKSEDDPAVGWRKATHLPPEQGFRGRVLGPAYRRGWIDAGQTARTEQQFLAGQRATLAVAASPATSLALAVKDPEQTDVCKVGAANCSWYPEFTQRYTITIRNGGRHRVRFYLVVE